MSNETAQLDRLEEAWQKLRHAIRSREVELAALKQEFEILDQARSLVILRGVSADDAPVLLQASRRRVGLKEAIQVSLAAAEFGLDLQGLVDAVDAKVEGSRYATERSLQAAVQTTVRRMLATGEVTMLPDENARRYILSEKVSTNGDGSVSPSPNT